MVGATWTQSADCCCIWSIAADIVVCGLLPDAPAEAHEGYLRVRLEPEEVPMTPAGELTRAHLTQIRNAVAARRT
jgi:hypothetical protein